MIEREISSFFWKRELITISLSPKQASPTRRQIKRKKNLTSINFFNNNKEIREREITDINSKDRSIKLICEFILIKNKILLKYHINKIISIGILLKIKNIVKIEK